MQNYHLLFRYIVVGDSGVGKSCFVQQFLDGVVRQEHTVTVGVEFGAKSIKLKGKNIKLQVWDTAGQQNYRSITRSYYRGAIGAFVVYDITRRATFEHIQNWIQQVKGNVGSKNDLSSQRMVEFHQGQQLAAKYDMSFIQTNYKDSISINKCFSDLSEKILDKVERQQIPLNVENIGIKTGDQFKKIRIKNGLDKNNKKKKCC